jgi:hypothetical protein
MFDSIKEKWKTASPADQIMAIATCVIAGTTIIYTVFSIIQTNISQNIFNTTKDNFMKSQKAFITTKNVEIRGASGIKLGVKPSGTPQAVLLYENSGQTPARKVNVDLFYCVGSEKLPKEFNFQHITDGKVISEGALVGPKDGSWFSRDIPPDNLIDIQNKKTIFVYGQISYSDIFKNRHKTEFCFGSFRYTFNAVNGTIIDYVFVRCNQHNCDDKDCDNQ